MFTDFKPTKPVEYRQILEGNLPAGVTSEPMHDFNGLIEGSTRLIGFGATLIAQRIDLPGLGDLVQFEPADQLESDKRRNRLLQALADHFRTEIRNVSGDTVFQHVTWEDVYILGFYDASGRGYFTSWTGDAPVIHVVVTGCRHTIRDPFPFLATHVPSGAGIHSIPPGWDEKDYAEELGGVRAFGWYLPGTVRRTQSRG